MSISHGVVVLASEPDAMLSGLNSFLIVQNFENSAHPTVHSGIK